MFSCSILAKGLFFPSGVYPGEKAARKSLTAMAFWEMPPLYRPLSSEGLRLKCSTVLIE